MKVIYSILLILFHYNFVNAQIYAESDKIIASDREELGRFGQSVAITDNYAVVGAFGMGSFNNGQAYIFEKQGVNWVQIQIIQNSDNENYDRFGYSVAIDGDYIVVGAYGEDDDVSGNNNLSKAGSAYIFKNNAGTWSQVQKIIASDRTASDEFGWSVDIDGNTILVGAHLEDEDENGLNTIYHAGSCYLFELNVGTGVWSQSQKIVPTSRAADISFPSGGYGGEDIADLFGHAVAISGDYLTVGSLNHDWNETNTVSTWNGGAVYIFEKSGGVWNEVQKIVNSDNNEWDRFGWSVAIDSHQVVASSYSHDFSAAGTNFMTNSGAAYIIKRDVNGNWSEQQKIVAGLRNPGDRFGWDVSIDNNFILAGTIHDNQDQNEVANLEDAGSVYIFKLNAFSLEYTQQQKIVASDRDSLDIFGNSVDIYGNQIIVGSMQHDFNELHNDSINNAGASYIYDEVSCPTVNTNQNISLCNGESITVGSNTYTTAGTYTDVLATSMGCDSVVSTIISLTNGFEITQNVSICYGESYSIGNSNYTTPGSFVDTLQMSSGSCDSIVYTNLNIVPPLDLSSSIDENTLESNQDNAGYQWIDCNNNFEPLTISGFNQQEITIEESGNYAVIINMNGCIDTSACVYVNFVGLGKTNTLIDLYLYPNPVIDILNIGINNSNNYSIEILDITGKRIYNSLINSEITKVNLASLNKGVYFIKIITKHKIITKQFVKL